MIYEENLRKEKEKYKRNKEYIDYIISDNNKKEIRKKADYGLKKEEENKKNNRTCPHCHGNNIIQVYNRPKGEIKGQTDSSYSSYHSSSFFSSYSSTHSKTTGKIDGHIDTLRVNKCNDCNHEWEYKKEFVLISSDENYTNKIDWYSDVKYFIWDCYRVIEEIHNFNPNDIKEEYTTVKEKANALIKKVKDGCWYENVKNLELEILYYYARNNITWFTTHARNYIFNEKYKYDVDIYMGSFNPCFEAFLIDNFGFNKHFND
jgi:hypothetical protein